MRVYLMTVSGLYFLCLMIMNVIVMCIHLNVHEHQTLRNFPKDFNCVLSLLCVCVCVCVCGEVQDE